MSKNNQIDIEILYPLRGKIIDTNNNILVSNKKVFDIYLIRKIHQILIKH